MYVASHDPVGAGNHYPTCVFHELTGLWCPGCGLTRGTYALLHGDLPAAVSLNVFTPLVLGVILMTWVAWVRRAWGRPPRPIALRLPRWWSPALIATVLAYGVVRNLPGFHALAP